jgi:hypothetical protein
MKHRRVIALCIGLALALPAAALSVDELDVNTDILVIGTVPPDDYGTANPAIAYPLGASLPLRIAGPFFVEPAIGIYGLLYEWTYDNATAVPTRVEAAGQFFTLCALVSLQAGVVFPVSSVISLGGTVGADFLLRFPLDWWNTDTSSTEGRTPSLQYFFSSGRFFYPETRLFLRWHIAEPLDLLFNVRALYPLFHAWDGRGASFIDEAMLSVGLGFAVRLKPLAKPAAAEETPAPGASTPAASAGTAPAAGSPPAASSADASTAGAASTDAPAAP